MNGLVRASALFSALSLGCAAGQSDEGPSWGPPTVVSDGGDDDDDDDALESDEGESGETGVGTEGFDDAADTDGGAPSPEPTSGAEPPAPAEDDGAEPPPPADDGGEPPPPPPDDGGLPPPGDLDAECQLFCGALQACGLVDADATAIMDCVSGCTVSEGPACDAAWSDVMSCVSSLDCFQMQLWSVAFPGYPCQAEDQAYGAC
jgi:hypothetical protein